MRIITKTCGNNRKVSKRRCNWYSFYSGFVLTFFSRERKCINCQVKRNLKKRHRFSLTSISNRNTLFKILFLYAFSYRDNVLTYTSHNNKIIWVFKQLVQTKQVSFFSPLQQSIDTLDSSPPIYISEMWCVTWINRPFVP